MVSFLTSPNITTPTKRRPRDEIDTSEPEFDDDHARRGFTQVANKESIRAIEAVIREETRCGEVTYRVRNVFCLSPTRSLLSHLAARALRVSAGLSRRIERLGTRGSVSGLHC